MNSKTQPKEIEIARRMTTNRTLRLLRAGDGPVWFDWRMTGGPAGDHTLYQSGEERARAHWQGYAQRG